MYSRIAACIVSFIMLVAATGCVSKRSLPELPPTIDGKGLLVAKLYVLGMHSIENASVTVDGRVSPLSMRDGYIVMALEPGRHFLSGVRTTGQIVSDNRAGPEGDYQQVKGSVPIFIYVPGYTIHFTTLTVGRSFDIEPGQVTNLGLMVYVPEEKPGTATASGNNARSFRVFPLDNSGEVADFLTTNYPEQTRALSSKSITLAPTNYLDPSRLHILRRMIAFHESHGPRVLRGIHQHFVYGRAGTIASFRQGSDGIPYDIRVLDVPGVADIVSAARTGDGDYYVTSDGSLLHNDGNSIVVKKLPGGVQPAALVRHGADGLLLIDNRFRVLTAAPPFLNWRQDDTALRREPRNDLQTAESTAGTYVSVGQQGLPDAMYFVKSGQASAQAIGLPQNLGGVKAIDAYALFANERGVFVVYSKPEFYFWSRAQQAWFSYARPGPRCLTLRVDGDTQELMVSCDGREFRSTDNGATWLGSST